MEDALENFRSAVATALCAVRHTLVLADGDAPQGRGYNIFKTARGPYTVLPCNGIAA